MSSGFSRYTSDDLFTGLLVSDCLRPCLSTVASVKEKTISRDHDNDYYRSVTLYFNERVLLTRTSVDRFSFLEALNFFGSNLGLWPGLGLYQLLELLAGLLVASKLLNKIKHCFF